MLASTAVTAAILLVLSKNAQAANHYPMKATHWKPLCKLAKELRKSGAQATMKLKTNMAEWKHLEKVKTKALLHALVHFDNESSTAARILADCAAREQKGIISSLDSNWKKAANAIAHTNDLAGGITSTIMSISTAAAKQSSGFCLENTATGGDGAGEMADAGCIDLTADVTSLQHAADTAVIDATGFKEITSSSAGNAASDTVDKCALFETAANPTTDAGITFHAQNTEGLAYGIIKLTQTQRPQVEDLKTLTGQHTGRGKLNAKRAHAAQQTINAIADRSAAADDAVLYAEIATGSSFNDCLTQEAMIRNPTKTVDQLEDVVRQVKKTHFGADNNLLTGLADSIGKTNVRGTSDKAATTKKLSELDDLGLLHKAVAYESAELASTLIAKLKEIESFRKSEQTKQKTPEQICNDIGDKNETGCKNTPECHFVASNREGRKCTLSEEAKQAVEKTNQEAGGKDAKTNATSSNSIVINKAPLWLAVFSIII
uniref:Variant surface glycoprotein 1125.4292 n=1 Tax=Trypanosoma brucei TaxID=5691 RepID=A0A1J0RAI9_9TRYP|nr:variant surface glycoprotein 1125.4292 [Trypanosoma brucei]